MKKILFLLALLLSLPAHAATPLCTWVPPSPGGQPSCVPVDATHPLPIGVYDASNTPGNCFVSNGSGSPATFQSCPGGGGGVTWPAQFDVVISPGASGNPTGIALTAGQLVIGQSSGTPLAEPISGDCTLSAAGSLICTKSNGTAFGTAAFDNTGTSGATIPLLNGNNTYSGIANFTSTFEIGGTTETFPGSGIIVGTTDTQTLTNKTMSGSSNTFSNIGNGSLVNSGITFGSTLVSLGGTVTNLNGVNIGPSTTGTGAFSTLAASSTITATGLSTGTQVSCLGLNSSNQFVLATGACGSGGGGTINLGTSAAATNPQRTSEAGTGFYSATDQTVSVAANGIQAMQWGTVGTGVDYVDVLPSAAGNPGSVQVNPAGSDTNINLSISPVGTGGVNIGTTTQDSSVELTVNEGPKNVGLQIDSSATYGASIQLTGSAAGVDTWSLFNNSSGGGAPHSICWSHNAGSQTVICFNTSTFVAISGYVYGWSNQGTYTNATADTGFSRDSTNGAGFIDFGTGAANSIAAVISAAKVDIGTATPTAGVHLDMGSVTDSMLLPSGTTGNRPGTGVAGMLRYNSSTVNLEDYVNSVWNAISQYGNWGQNLTASPYLFATNGTTDNSTNMTTALGVALPVVEPVTASGSAIQNVTVPSYSDIRGMGTAQYLNAGTSSKFVAASGASNVLNLGTNSFITFENGVDIMGAASGTYSSTVTCLAGAPSTIYMFNSSFRFCGQGAIGSTSNYIGTIRDFGSVIYGNGHQNNAGGITNPVDGQFIGGSFTANYDGIQASTGANNNVSDVSVRYEYNLNSGINAYQSNNNWFGGTFDRQGNMGITLSGNGASTGAASPGKATGTMVTGVFTRNATNNTTGEDSNIVSTGGNYNTIYSDIITSHDCGDSGCTSTPPDSPKYALEFATQTGGGIDYGVRIGTGFYGGYTVAPINWNGGGYPVDFGVWNALGISPSVAPYESDFYGALTLNGVSTPSIGTITTGGTAGSTTYTYKLVCNVAPSTGGTTAASSAVSITTGNATLSTTNYNSIPVTIPEGCYQGKLYRTASGGTPSSTGLIISIPAQQSVVLDTGLAGDSTTPPTTNTTGNLSVATGYILEGGQTALWQDVTNANLAVGYTAFISTISQSGGGTNGQDNVAIGPGALNANTTGYQNVAVGLQAQNGTTTGIENSALGWQALYSNTTGSYNTGFGAQALYSNTTGTKNTAVGTAAYTCNGCSQNVGIGFQALNNITTGQNNVGIGYQAAQTITSGGSNTVIGTDVGSTVLTTGSNNLLLGTSSATTTSGAAVTNEIHIGAGGGDIFSATGSGTNTTAIPVINGTVNMPNLAASSAAQTGTVCWSTGSGSTAGRLTVDTTLACLSSRTDLKKDIAPLKSALVEIEKLKPVVYHWKNKPEDKEEQLGFLAEQVAGIDGRLVGYDDKGNIRGVRYQQALVTLAIAAIQDQQKEIDAQNKIIKGLLSHKGSGPVEISFTPEPQILPYHKCFFGLLMCANR